LIKLSTTKEKRKPMLPNNNFNTNIIAASINRITKIPMNIDISVIIVVIVLPSFV
jgi:hypothetical protein